MHKTVLLHEAVDALQVEPGNWYIDATFGRGGHTREILSRGGKVLALDVDTEAIEYGQTEFKSAISAEQVVLLRRNFSELAAAVKSAVGNSTFALDNLRGILFDFGTSSDQLLADHRGFGFTSSAPLDMRMDDRLGVTAEDLLRVLPVKQLEQLFKEHGEFAAYRLAPTIKKWIARFSAAEHPSAQELADLIAKHNPRTGHLHPATKIFQALRVAVNQEMDVISQVLVQIPNLLKQGRIITIAFHEGEDRLVKQQFVAWEKSGYGHRINKDVLTPGAVELEENPRSRSAKLRIFEV